MNIIINNKLFIIKQTLFVTLAHYQQQNIIHTGKNMSVLQAEILCHTKLADYHTASTGEI